MPGGMGMEMDEDDDFGGFTSGAQRRPKKSSQAPPPTEIVRPLALTLEELYKGTTKRLKVSRKLLTGVCRTLIYNGIVAMLTKLTRFTGNRRESTHYQRQTWLESRHKDPIC